MFFFTLQKWRRATSMSCGASLLVLVSLLALKLHGFYDSRGHKASQHLLTREGKILLVDYWRTYGCVLLWKWLLWVCSFRPACVRWRDGKHGGCLSKLTETIYRTAKYKAGTTCTDRGAGTKPNWVRWAGVDSICNPLVMPDWSAVAF